MEPDLSEKSPSDRNFDVEYVLVYSFKDADQAKAARQFKILMHTLSQVGLEAAVRPAAESSLFVFVKAPESKLISAMHKARLKDWIYGIRHAQPDAEDRSLREPETEAEHLRTIHDLMTLPKHKGGAGITPQEGEWEYVESIFPLHDNDLNKQWIKNWSSKTFLTDKDLDQIRGRLGEKVAFYFAFLQAYFAFLMVPASFGVACWALLGQFSVVFSIVNSLACLVFVEYWKRQEIDLGLRWRVKGVSSILSERRGFKPEKETEDPVTGERVQVFPIKKRLARQLLQVPFSFVSILVLGTLITTCYAIEIFISEIYSGPFKSVLEFVPTVLLSLLVPTISKVLTAVATRLNDYENYESQEEHDSALTRKIFVLNFLTSYLPVILTAFVYLPFAHILVPYLDIFHRITGPLRSDKAAKPTLSKFSINRARLRQQVVYFAVTGQVVDFALETVVPYAQRKFLHKYQEMSEEKKKNNNGDTKPAVDGKHDSKDDATVGDAPGEAEFLERVRSQAELSQYDVTADLREMCVQFGYLSLFSPVWSLVPLFFLLNNWVELRSDFVKICIECKRPTPFRADSIGPWLDSMSFLAWLGSITSAALVYLFGRYDETSDVGVAADERVKGWVLLIVIFFAEHGYLLAKNAVASGMKKIETPATKKERGERFYLRRRYLQSGGSTSDEQKGTQQKDADGQTETTKEDTDKMERDSVSRKSLEEEARRLSMHSSTESDLFWSRQRGWKEAAQVGVGIIQEAARQTEPTEKKAQ